MPQSIYYKDLITNEACFPKAGRFILWHQFSPVGLKRVKNLLSLSPAAPKNHSCVILKGKV